ncbi:cytochrome c oxidase assembly protein [Sabulicella rubraurantiaca]|uniref:cytochrome c oxidase assembly protein n=1 Tax=Sabulicella rubraurantiaca TaxID=2811429 RepID=UPI001A971AF5|nr:cytochrome c oxidase assembly protein [Sabulicella rubraurantiaca]
MLALASFLGGAILLWAGAAAAHAGAAPDEGLGWSFDAWTTVPLVVGGLLLGLGWMRLARRTVHGTATLRRRAGLLALGWAGLVLALVSPMAAAGHLSFSAHMLQHEILMLWSAPLLVLGRPLAFLIWGLPEAARPGLARLLHAPVLVHLGRGLTHPVAATLLQSAVLWLWHAPQLFERALDIPAWHVAQHMSFFLSALAFWVAMIDRCPRTLAGRCLAALCLFATSLVSGALGALMAISESPWYAGYARLGLTPLGLSPAEDQQLAGLLMWVPGGLLHAAAALALLAGAFRLSLDVPHARQS